MPDLFLFRLDPSTRSSIWGLISSFATSERSMIITTHMMLEADALCSRIAIVSQGKLKVIGTQQYLKDTFGSGYLLQLNLVQSTPENQERAMNYVIAARDMDPNSPWIADLADEITTRARNVTEEDIKAVAEKVLDRRQSVTGWVVSSQEEAS